MSSRPPTALVLTAGLGTRLRPLTLVRAKPAAPVAGVALVSRILGWLFGQGIRDVVLNLHHRPETITGIVGHGEAFGMRVRYSWEQPILGSAGGPRRALPLIDTDPFLIVNGDTLTDVDLAALTAAHAAGGRGVTLATIPNVWRDRYGGLIADESGRVTGLTTRGSAHESLHFIGVQVANKCVFAQLPDGTVADSVGGLYRSLMRSSPGMVRAHVVAARFFDIGTANDYLQTSLAFAAAENRVEALVSSRARIFPTAMLDRTVVWDDVAVGPGCRLSQCVIADGVALPAFTSLDRACVVPTAALAGSAPPPGSRALGNATAVPLPPDGGVRSSD